jgi:dihydroorotase-like cyclic amidohydrolase
MDYTDYYISPGVIDLNLTVNHGWDSYERVTQAAVSGGTTFLITSPNIFSLPETEFGNQ